MLEGVVTTEETFAMKGGEEKREGVLLFGMVSVSQRR